MKDIDKKDFALILTGCGELYEKAISKELARIYFEALKQYDIEQVKAAFSAHVNDAERGMYMPKPADIVRNIEGTKKGDMALLRSTAEMQWQEVVQKISRVGAYGTPKFADQTTLAAVAGLGGWPFLCSLTTDKLEWKGKEFVSTYQDYATMPVESLPKHVAGLIEQSRHKNQGSGMLNSLINQAEKRKLEGKAND